MGAEELQLRLESLSQNNDQGEHVSHLIYDAVCDIEQIRNTQGGKRQHGAVSARLEELLIALKTEQKAVVKADRREDAQFRKIALIAGGILLLALLITGLWLIVKDGHDDAIEQVIAERGGKVVRVEEASDKESPLERKKFNVVYRIEYEQDGRMHVAWYRGMNRLGGREPSSNTLPEQWLFEQ